jgi:cold shock CspA family protein
LSGSDRRLVAPSSQLGVRGPVAGTVTAFDAHRGLGVVTDERGREWPFHATSLADGSRCVDVGTAVIFVPAAGNLGRMEARQLRGIRQVGGSES